MSKNKFLLDLVLSTMNARRDAADDFEALGDDDIIDYNNHGDDLAKHYKFPTVNDDSSEEELEAYEANVEKYAPQAFADAIRLIKFLKTMTKVIQEMKDCPDLAILKEKISKCEKEFGYSKEE